MTNSQVEYSYWASLDIWTLKETIDLVTNFIMSDSINGEGEYGFSKGRVRFNLWCRLSSNIQVFVSENTDIVYQHVNATSTPVGEPFIETELANELTTQVNVRKFLRWASSENLKLPRELKDVLAKSAETRAIDLTTKSTSCEIKRSLDEYRFEKVGGVWNIAYQDVVLKGVKSLLGLDIIKILLQNPNKKLSVIHLQQMTGTSDAGSIEDNGYPSAEEDGLVNHVDMNYGAGSNESQYGSASDPWAHSDAIAIKDCKRRIEEINAQLEIARGGSVVNRSKIQRLETEREEIEAYLSEANRKPKDPELEKYRKKVSKNINEAVTKIAKLESMLGYNDNPISKHLNRHIRKGSNCSYHIDESVLPAWRF